MTIEAVETRTPRKSLATFGKYAVLSVAAFFTLAPVVWTVITALSPSDVDTGATEVGFGAFRDVFDQIPVWIYAWNSALVTLDVAAHQPQLVFVDDANRQVELRHHVPTQQL
jgi:multiple sugar transport system permease protein